MAGSGSRMKRSCACCQGYLEHLDGKMSCFLRRMTADSRHCMILPDRFVNHFGGDISGTIKLQSPNGILYVVEVIECKNKTVLKCGWQAFVDAHHIQENDSLLFRHIENSRFEVLILDSNDCEKVFSCSGIKNTCSIQGKNVDPASISGSSCDDTAESSESEGFARYQNGSFSHRRKTAKLASSSSSPEDSGEDSSSDSGHEYVDSGDLETSQEPYVLCRRSHLSKVQEEKVDALIEEIHPEITVFVAIMRKSNVQLPAPCLVISSGYAAVHFPHTSGTVTLQSPCRSKKWHVMFHKRRGSRLNILRGHWADFVKDNRVQEQDICVFVPMKGSSSFTFMVHLLRAAATYPKGGTVIDRIGSSLGIKDLKSASDISIKEEPIEEENVFSKSNRDGVSDESQESEDSEGPADPPYILPCKNRLSRLQKKIVQERVRSIQSRVPIYVAIMKKSNVGLIASRSQLELGARYAAAVDLPGMGRRAVVLQRSGQRWATVMQIRSGSRRLLLGGWHSFVRDNRLRVGDICLLELKKDERKLTMAVHICRKEQFF
ncbi:B3 domain-containing protein Os03g0619600-like [Oryza brachyantha]|uniref:B3 domain-containing protein Os03g0619600-like n=1 Tax=Oryza brachyantha TaxID=4533 RepID=UPI0003EAD065|nr:B3 domain-containing protein Os03g0619600-like [Oryza brachyantha]